MVLGDEKGASLVSSQFVTIQVHTGEKDHTGNGPARVKSMAGQEEGFSSLISPEAKQQSWNRQTQGKQPMFKGRDHWPRVPEYIIQPPSYFSLEN